LTARPICENSTLDERLDAGKKPDPRLLLIFSGLKRFLDERQLGLDTGNLRSENIRSAIPTKFISFTSAGNSVGASPPAARTAAPDRARHDARVSGPEGAAEYARAGARGCMRRATISRRTSARHFT